VGEGLARPFCTQTVGEMIINSTMAAINITVHGMLGFEPRCRGTEMLGDLKTYILRLGGSEES